MEEMKISKIALLAMSGIFTLASLGLMFLSVSANGSDPEDHRVQLYFDPNNAVQHFQGVKIIATEVNDDSSATIKKSGGLVGIDTDYNFLLSGGNIKDNSITKGVRRSSILGGKNNNIEKGQNETILGGEGNRIIKGVSNSILGGSDNILGSGEDSVIFGGKGNGITGNYSSIIGGEGNKVTKGYAIAIGNNNGSDGYNSVAMGSGSKVSGKHSFLWTDGSSSSNLSRDNVFVVKGTNGMVINTNKAHDLAQLTVGGPLIIYRADDDPSSGQCNNNTKGVVKLVDNDDNKKCLCSCDGSGRNALHDGVMCPFKCSGKNPKPVECGNGGRVCSTNPYTYTGTCKSGTVVQGTGAFFVSTEKIGSNFVNYINWSCQSETGYIKMCSGVLDNNGCPNKQPESNGKCTGPDPDFAELVEGTDDVEVNTDKQLVPYGQRYSKKCAYICKENYYYDEGKCKECPNEYDPETHGCVGQRACDPVTQIRYYDEESGEWRCENKDQGACIYIVGGEEKKYTRENGGWFSYSNITNYYDVVPYGTKKKATCIDGAGYNDEFEYNSCKYECKKNYYCRLKGGTQGDFASCEQAKCTRSTAYDNGTKSKYNTGGKAGAYIFSDGAIITPELIAEYYEEGKIYDKGYHFSENKYNYGVSLTQNDVDYIKEKLKLKVDITKTGEVVNYLKNLNKEGFNDLFRNSDFQKCVYWCPKEDRFTGTFFENGVSITYSDVNYRCVNQTQREYLQLKSENNYCRVAKFFGFSGKIKYKNSGANTPDQSWTYVPWNEYSDSKIPCKWTCAPGYELLTGYNYAPRKNSSIYNSNGYFRKNLFALGSDWGTEYHTCYKQCESGYYLSNNGEGENLSCKSCTDGNILSLIQTGKVGTKDISEYRGCSCPSSGDEWSSYWKNDKCNCYAGLELSGGKCVCKGDTTLSKKNTCVCLGNATINKNYQCSCGLGEVYEKGTGCVCDKLNKYFRDENKGKCVTSATCEEGLIDCKGKCYDVQKSQIIDMSNCNVTEKRYNLGIDIQKSDKNTKIYKKGDIIKYNVTVNYNGGNISIGGYNMITYYMSGGSEKRIKHYNSIKDLSGANKSITYTGEYKLGENNFNGLTAGQTGEFNILVKLLSGGVSDYMYGNGETLTSNLTVIIEK